MANKKITDLTELTAAASDDYLEIVDTSANTSKKISRENLIGSSGGWQSWTPTVTGWAAGYTCNARYCKVGKLVSVKIQIMGTSNSTNVYITLPFASVADSVFAWAYALDNGTAQATPAYVVLDSTSRIRVLLDATGKPWTASGGKRVMTTFTYEAA